MADDVWAGIPVELREKLAEWGGEMARQAALGISGPDESKEGKALADALRSLLSRLQEAEKQRDEALRAYDMVRSAPPGRTPPAPIRSQFTNGPEGQRQWHEAVRDWAKASRG